MFSGQDKSGEKKGAKQGLSAKAGAQRRERHLQQVRHQAAGDALRQLRRQEINEDGEGNEVGEEMIPTGPLDVWAYDKTSPPHSIPLALLGESVQLAQQGQTPKDVFQGVLLIRKMLSVESNVPYTQVVSSGIVPRLVELLDRFDVLAASSGSLVLPAMTGGAGMNGENGGAGGGGLLANPLASAYAANGTPFSRPGGENTINFQKERAAPELNLRARLQSVVGSTYNGCGAFDLEMAPSQVQAICRMVDQCVDDVHSAQLATTLSLYLPQHAVHVFNVITKRLQEFYAADPIRKLLVVYAVTKVVLQTSLQSYREHQQEMERRQENGGERESAPVLYTPAALNAFLMTLLAASERQSRDGADRLITIMDGLQHHSTLLAPLNEVSPGYKASFDAQLKEIRVTAEAEQDLSSILSRRKHNFS